ncbi:MAG: hydrogenase nickel incorporation protein HypB [Bacillota bacterium]|nr:hydrogenase nickel incorporation protein HypB [Bacillota bacterium]
MSSEINVMESIYSENEKIADELKEELENKNVFSINVLGAPGIGKTSTLIQLIPKIPYKSFVIEGDIASDLDTQKLNALGIQTVQINTGGACHLDSPFIRDAAENLNVQDGIMWIENIGNLVCPAEFFIGEHIKMLIVGVTEGSDKPYKYPLAFEKADVILLNKCDLLPYVDFDEDFFMAGVRKLTNAPVIHISSKSGDGIDEAVNWILSVKK